MSGWYPSARSPQNGDFVKYQVDMLRRKGWHMDVIHHDLSIDNWDSLGKNDRVVKRSAHGVTITQSSWMPPRWGGWMMKWWREAYLALVSDYIDEYGTPDIIHAHTYLGGWVALAVRERYGVPIVLTEHYTGLMTGQVSPSHQQIMRSTYQEVDHLTAVSSALSDAIYQKYNRRPKVLPNFINAHLFKLKKHKTTTSNKIKLITVGELIPRKQIDLLLETMAITTGVSLTIVGDGPERERLIKMAHQRNLENIVTFKGRLTQTELAGELVQHDIYVHPSRVETFGLVLVEAMSCGLPVVTFDNGGARDIVTDETGVLVAEHTPVALSQGIEHIICDWLCYDGHRIRQHVLDQYTVSAVGRQLYDIYAKLIRYKKS